MLSNTKNTATEDVCDHCHSATEDVHHTLWDCHELSALWESNALWQFRRTKKFSNIFELVSHVLEEKKNLELFATLVWMIWSQRNTLRTSSKPFPLSQVTPSASQTVISQFDWLCDMCGCVMSPTSDIYWVDLGFINNYKEPQ